MKLVTVYYSILKVKNALVKTAYYVIKNICHLVIKKCFENWTCYHQDAPSEEPNKAKTFSLGGGTIQFPKHCV